MNCNWWKSQVFCLCWGEMNVPNTVLYHQVPVEYIDEVLVI
jgi:hypothetical protein